MGEPSAAGRERRQHQRVRYRSVAHLLLPDQQPLEVRTFDIGLGGVAIVASGNPPTHSSCALRLTIPVRPQGSAIVEVQAKVVYSVLSTTEDGFMIGLQFISLSAAAETAIMQFVRARSLLPLSVAQA
jgi:c-di-GMP-binding flagellar brake protein YcgR